MTNISDGCIAHVSLKLKTADVRAAHDGEVYRLLEKAAASRSFAESTKYFEREQIESEKVKVAQEEIMKLASLGLRTLLCMEVLPDMIDENSKLELRLLLCRVEPQ
jgi:hypothetical protein